MTRATAVQAYIVMFSKLLSSAAELLNERELEILHTLLADRLAACVAASTEPGWGRDEP